MADTDSTPENKPSGQADIPVINNFDNTEEKPSMTPEDARRLIRESRPALFAIADMKHTNSVALHDLTLIAAWCGIYRERCMKMEMPGAAENFKFMQFVLEQSARGLMDVMFRSQVQPDLPGALIKEINEGKEDIRFEDYSAAVIAETPLELEENAPIAGMLVAMHSNLERLFVRVAEASQEARLTGPEPMRQFHTQDNANPLVAVASASLTVDRSYQLGAYGTNYWIFLPNNHRDTWRGTNLTRILPEDLPQKFCIPCSFMHISEVPGIPEDDSLPLDAFSDGTWAPLHDNSVTQYCFESIKEWLSAVK